MLIKEYRIPLPLTVEEYRIAQLYMIAVSRMMEIFSVLLFVHSNWVFDRKKVATRAKALEVASRS